MIIETDDRGFGIAISRLPGYKLFRLQMIFPDGFVGDGEGCLIWADLETLANLKRIDNERLNPSSASPGRLIDTVNADDSLHDAIVVNAAAFDGWWVYGYRWRGQVIVITKRWEGGDAPTMVVTSESDFDSVVDSARAYWAKNVDSIVNRG